ncbi:ATP-binding protein [Amycolatopsis sp. NBC_01307]|uniref:ATP-binding protein n=1 Tax=Amycolatopsis sp. NBC_01307 TaxID=2903561 RepID=UPI002E14AC81|nr:ATP-binding protein [Amycolatopsis sp. NBC_01307]
MSAQPGESEHSTSSTSDATYDLDTTATREIRRHVRDLLASYRGIPVDDAVLVIDELVSNAHQHGQSPRTCRLTFGGRGRSLRVEVDDASPHQPRIRTADETGGRGLMLVDRLAPAWGVTHHAHTKTVWAELALDRAGNAPHLATAQDWSR